MAQKIGSFDIQIIDTTFKCVLLTDISTDTETTYGENKITESNCVACVIDPSENNLLVATLEEIETISKSEIRSTATDGSRRKRKSCEICEMSSHQFHRPTFKKPNQLDQLLQTEDGPANLSLVHYESYLNTNTNTEKYDGRSHCVMCAADILAEIDQKVQSTDLTSQILCHTI